jgi:hypothetical protein
LRVGRCSAPLERGDDRVQIGDAAGSGKRGERAPDRLAALDADQPLVRRLRKRDHSDEILDMCR